MQSYVLMLQTDVDDRDITEAMLSGIDLVIPVKFLDNMDKLASFVTEQGQPALILISENERHAGIEIIKRLKNNSFYKHIPLVILAEKSLSEYIKECYAAGAASFIIKPSTVELTKKKIENFFTYWFQVAELPKGTMVESN
jgi:CheY-like chemotaxis protein